MKEIKPIAIFRSPFTSKFGVPRQSGLVEELRGEIILEPEYNNPDAIRGLEKFDYLWLIWGFSANKDTRNLTVRPPRLGGNERLGVFATRSPFRPNGLGLSSVRIVSVGEGVIVVSGADLMDGTPIYDIKPYIPYTDCHPEANGGFTEEREWRELTVDIPEDVSKLFSNEQGSALRNTLALDPRPHYHTSEERIYGMPFFDYDIRFQVKGNTLKVIEAKKIKTTLTTDLQETFSF